MQQQQHYDVWPKWNNLEEVRQEKGKIENLEKEEETKKR